MMENLVVSNKSVNTHTHTHNNIYSVLNSLKLCVYKMHI